MSKSRCKIIIKTISILMAQVCLLFPIVYAVPYNPTQELRPILKYSNWGSQDGFDEIENTEDTLVLFEDLEPDVQPVLK